MGLIINLKQDQSVTLKWPDGRQVEVVLGHQILNGLNWDTLDAYIVRDGVRDDHPAFEADVEDGDKITYRMGKGWSFDILYDSSDSSKGAEYAMLIVTAPKNVLIYETSRPREFYQPRMRAQS